MTETADSAKSLNCQWCGMRHISPGVCPMVKALEYYPDGTLKRVELKTAADYPKVEPGRGQAGNPYGQFGTRPGRN